MKQVTGNKTPYTTETISIRVDPDGFSVITPMGETSHQMLSTLMGMFPQIPYAVNIIWTTPQVTLIPQEFYNPATLNNFLETASMPCDTPMANNTMHYQIVAVWNANSNYTQEIDALLPGARHLHAIQLIINQATKPNTLYIVVENAMAHIVSTDDNQIDKALTAIVTSPEDLLYFAAATTTDACEVKLLGDISPQITETLKPYFSKIDSYPTQNYLSITLNNIQ